MRTLLVLLVGACSADIAPGTYFCGPEQLCPEGLTCDAVEDICTVPSQAGAFECEIPDRTGDDEPAAGLLLQPALDCVSGVRELKACLFVDDPGDLTEASVLPAGLPRIAVEAGTTDGWYKYIGLEGRVIGIDRFGESAPAGELFKYFGITADAVVQAVKSVL